MGRPRREHEAVWPERDWCAIRAEADSGTAELLIYDRIGEGVFTDGVTARDLVKQLAALDVSELDVRINSPGGSVFDGLAIHNALRAHPARVTTHIDGLAASVASVVAMAGDEVRMAGNALMMIHEPYSALVGTADELRREAGVLDKIQTGMVAIYAERSGGDPDDIAAAMAAETWYTAEEAAAAGYVDRVAEESPASAYYEDLTVFAASTPPPMREPKQEEPTMAVSTQESDPDVRLMERIDQLEARIAETARPAAAPARPLGVIEAFTRQLTGYDLPHRRLAALADVLSTGNAGLLPPVWSTEVRGYIDSMRYMISRAGSASFPGSGTGLTVPKITQDVLVGPRGTEKTNPPSRALTTGSDTYDIEWLAGAVDVAYELIEQGEPGVLELVVRRLIANYAAVSDLTATAAAEDAATASGAALDTADYAGLIGDLIDSGEAIRVATGMFGDRLSATSADWKAILGLVDADGRRVLATQGGSNADGSASLDASAVNVGGVLVFHNPRATVTVQFNTESFRVAEKAPESLRQNNVGLLGVDVGIVGAIIPLPLYPAGIIAYKAPAAARAAGK